MRAAVADACPLATVVPTPARTLRVLTLTPFYPSTENPQEGGFVAEVLPFTQRLGIMNEVVAVRPLHRARADAVESKIPCRWKRHLSVPGNIGLSTAGASLAMSLNSQIRKLRRERCIDLIHAHAALPCGDAAARLSRKWGVPFVVSVHGLDVYSERQAGRAFGPWCRHISERVYREARAVICISEKVRQQLADVSANTTVICNGVDPLMFFPAPEPTPPHRILSVGNLIPSKGHAILLQAFAHVSTSIPDCELEIIGDGPERRDLERLATELEINSRVRFLGKQSRAEVAMAMRRCTFFALPSSYEGLGCVYLEAMACAKPAVACEGQGIEGIIQHGVNGLLVPAEAPKQLGMALGMLLNNGDLRNRIGKAARATILRRHSFEHQAEQLVDLYRECAS